VARRRRRRNAKISDGVVLASVGGGILAVALLVQLIRAHLVLTLMVSTVAVAAAAMWGYLRWSAMSRLTAYERDVAVTDHMSGADFEQYVARLLRGCGCRGVRVSGRAGDMGADVTARTPDGRRLVVQCKRYAGNLSSPDVQRFAGTARDIHGADVALLVTTGRPTTQALQVARQCRIDLVDRPVLARWIATGISPDVLISDRGRR
jgi:restriction system protein